MKSRVAWFNNNLLSGLLVVAALGCTSPGATSDAKAKGSKRDATLLRIFQETGEDGRSGGTPVPVYRASPVPVYIDKAWFLDEGQVEQAAVVNVLDGFAIQIKFNVQGTWALESATTAKKGYRIVIWAQWTEARWLAAPLMSQPIKDGVVSFTPDATREEAERIVRGLNNLAEQQGNKPKAKKR